MFNTENIKNIRLVNKKTQEETAQLLSIKRSTYSMWESNKDVFPIKRLIKFCTIFNTSLDYALGLAIINNYETNNFKLEKQGERLKEFRKEQKLTQDKLASYLGTTKTVICGYEKNRYIISTSNIFLICQKYNISADYLLGRIDSPKYLK